MPAPVRRSRATGRVTLTDVARVAKVSAITASRAVNGTRAVDPALVERVRRAVRKLGYVPDPAARALASRRGTHVALLLPTLSDALVVEVLDAAQEQLRAAGFQVLIGITHHDDREEARRLREQLAHRPAGLLVAGLPAAATRRLIVSSGVPCVHLMDLSDRPDDYSVGYSQQDAAAAMTRHLLERGHRRIAFAAASLDQRSLWRLDGWRRELAVRGLHTPTLEWLDPAPSSPALGAQMFERIMGQSPPVQAIFFCNDVLAQGALLAAARHGVEVPGCVAIAGFDDRTGSDQMLPPLTTVQTPRRRIGREAAAMLIALMRGETVEAPRLDLGFSLAVRNSS